MMSIDGDSYDNFFVNSGIRTMNSHNEIEVEVKSTNQMRTFSNEDISAELD